MIWFDGAFEKRNGLVEFSERAWSHGLRIKIGYQKSNCLDTHL